MFKAMSENHKDQAGFIVYVSVHTDISKAFNT